jgi:putative MATE family efflux protein
MIKQFFSDRRFYTTMLKLAVPITIQQFVSSSTNLLDVLMIGQLGETAIAALGLSNQIFFLLAVFLFGVSSGSAIFTAQYWGKGDMVNLRKVMGIGLTLAISVGLFYTIIALVIPEKILGLYTEDQAVIKLGSQYLRIVGFGYIFTAITLTFMSVLRSTQNVRLPMTISIIALTTNIFLNYCLIFGNFGFPELGVRGAALGTLIARIFEFIMMIFFSYRFKTAAAAKLSELKYNFNFFKKVLRTSMPAAVNELFWSLGITTYYAVYARIGTDAVAAVNITSTIENMTFVIFIGAANACAIMIGNQIGADNEDQAFIYGLRFLVICILLSLFLGLVVLILRPFILSLYNIEQTSYDYAYKIQFIYALSMWIRVSNLILFIGILRSGGDTRYALLVEMASIWLIGVPSALLGGFVFHWPVYYVYALVLSEEIVKLIIVIPRFRSRKWIHNLTSISDDLEVIQTAI